MKTYKVLISFIALVFTISGTGLALETASVAVPQDLAQFEAAYSGTKPVVASMKFWEAKQIERFPITTLSTERMRIDYDAMGQGTKAHIKPAKSVSTPWFGPYPSLGSKALVELASR